MDDLEARIDALYAGAATEFTAGRDALAGELRAAGDREAATRVGALRRPTKLAAELNRLAREAPPALAAAIAAQDALAQAQRAMLDTGHGTQELGDAAEAERRALAALSADPAIQTAARAAARRPDERELLRRGRLSHDPEPDFGGGLTVAPPAPAPPPAPPRPTRAAPEPEQRPTGPGVDDLADRRRRREREAREAARAEARELARAAAANARDAGARVSAARRERARAERAREKAEADVERLAGKLRSAEAVSAAARDSVAETERAERGAAQALEEAERLVAEARNVLEQLAPAEGE